MRGQLPGLLLLLRSIWARWGSAPHTGANYLASLTGTIAGDWGSNLGS